MPGTASTSTSGRRGLAAHRADQALEDVDRPIAAEHDIADGADQPVTGAGLDALETALPDARDIPAEHVVDEPGRVPRADESRAAVVRAQAALAEIEQRRALDDRRVEEERRAAQLNRWAAEDAAATTAERADVAVY